MLCLLDFVFLNLAFTLVVVGALINTVEDHLPLFVKKNFRYGKFALAGEAKSSPMILREFPKSYFRHFYVSATVLTTVTLVYTLRVFYYEAAVPYWIKAFLNFWCGADRKIAQNSAATVLALFLLTVQCYRRLYETLFVQVFANSSKINLSHYLIGHFHYIGCVIAILGHSSKFVNYEENEGDNDFNNTLTLLTFFPTIALFWFAWKNQYKNNKVLANLRKNDSQKVVSQKYFLPTGEWFQYISSPHLLCEILIYISLSFILMKNVSWICILAWVISNQVETAILSHNWYKKTFPKLPKRRKALIPFIF